MTESSPTPDVKTPEEDDELVGSVTGGEKYEKGRENSPVLKPEK